MRSFGYVVKTERYLKPKKQQYKHKLINSLEQEQDRNPQTFRKTLATIKKQEPISNNRTNNILHTNGYTILNILMIAQLVTQ